MIFNDTITDVKNQAILTIGFTLFNPVHDFHSTCTTKVQIQLIRQNELYSLGILTVVQEDVRLQASLNDLVYLMIGE
jgi:hypothetical protein